MPARHGPVGCEEITGDVSGFVLESAGSPTIYISGDNAAVELVDEIAARFPSIENDFDGYPQKVKAPKVVRVGPPVVLVCQAS